MTTPAKSKNQLFIIPQSTWDATSVPEIEATVATMKELGLFKLPYPVVDVWLEANNSFGWNATNIARSCGIEDADLQKDQDRGLFEFSSDRSHYRPKPGAGFVFEVRGLSLESSTLSIAMHASPGTKSAKFYRTQSTQPVIQENWVARDIIAEVLIVLLATRNAIKSTCENKLAKLGIGKKDGAKSYRYVTTISLPREAEPANGDEPSAPGAAKRPHLRRGHIRSQHYGPGNTLIKQIFIEPVFVNADKDWVDQRERYNVSL